MDVENLVENVNNFQQSNRDEKIMLMEEEGEKGKRHVQKGEIPRRKLYVFREAAAGDNRYLTEFDC